MPKKSYGVKVGDRYIFVTNNRLEHILPIGEELQSIVGVDHYSRDGNKSKARLSAELARNVFRSFWKLLLQDLLANPITFFFPWPGIVLRIEDIADIFEKDVKRYDLRFRYEKDAAGNTRRHLVSRTSKQAFIYQPVLRFFSVSHKNSQWLSQNYLYRFVLSKPYRNRLHQNVQNGKKYFRATA
jgi:hypothetical protein